MLVSPVYSPAAPNRVEAPSATPHTSQLQPGKSASPPVGTYVNPISVSESIKLPSSFTPRDIVPLVIVVAAFAALTRVESARIRKITDNSGNLNLVVGNTTPTLLVVFRARRGGGRNPFPKLIQKTSKAEHIIISHILMICCHCTTL